MSGYLESWFSFGGMRGWGIHRPEEGSKIERETFQSGTRTNLGHCSSGWGGRAAALVLGSLSPSGSFVPLVFTNAKGHLGLSFG